MKIAFDAKRITHNATGLGNYSRFVVNSLSASFPEHIYQLYTPGKGKEALRKRIESVQVSHSIIRKAGSINYFRLYGVPPV